MQLNPVELTIKNGSGWNYFIKYIPGSYILLALNQVSTEDSQVFYCLMEIWILKTPLISKSILDYF